MQSRFFATLVAAALVTAPLHVAYAAPPTVEELYTQGQAKFDASEYGDAGDLWGQAVQLLPEDEDNSATRRTIMNLALDAYLRAYRSSEDRSHIDDAKTLLDEYEAALAGSDTELSPEIATEKQKIEEILAEIAAKEAEAKEPEVVPEPIVEPDPVPVTNEKPGRGLVIGGGALLGVGAVGIGLLVGGAVGSSNVQTLFNAAADDSPEKLDYSKRGRTLNALAITGAVIAPLFIGAGVALLVIGLKKNKQASQSQVMVMPTVGPEHVGLGFTGRF